jgi:hypothetical protein
VALRSPAQASRRVLGRMMIIIRMSSPLLFPRALRSSPCALPLCYEEGVKEPFRVMEPSHSLPANATVIGKSCEFLQHVQRKKKKVSLLRGFRG